jgi:hypothetical protein
MLHVTNFGPRRLVEQWRCFRLAFGMRLFSVMVGSAAIFSEKFLILILSTYRWRSEERLNYVKAACYQINSSSSVTNHPTVDGIQTELQTEKSVKPQEKSRVRRLVLMTVKIFSFSTQSNSPYTQTLSSIFAHRYSNTPHTVDIYIYIYIKARRITGYWGSQI